MRSTRLNVVGSVVAGLPFTGGLIDAIEFPNPKTLLSIYGELSAMDTIARRGVIATLAGIQTARIAGGGFLLAHFWRKSEYASLIVGAIAEARLGATGLYSERLAAILNRSIYKKATWGQRFAGRYFSFPAEDKRRWQKQLAGRRLTAVDVLSANRTLDAAGGLCTRETRILSPSEYAGALLEQQGSAF